MESAKVGQLAGKNSQRDAIHVAIAPVVANEVLYPGTHVGFVTSSQEIVGKCKSPIGIVDPFLMQSVPKGSRFFLFLYPNTVTSLRHEWTHPAFSAVAIEPATDEKSESEKWLREFADRADLGYQAVLNAGHAMIEYGDCYTQMGTESARTEWYAVDPELFWKHFENVTGVKCPDDKKNETVFSCSC